MLTHLHINVPLKVILKSLELQLQDWREILKQDAFSCILQAAKAVHFLEVGFQHLFRANTHWGTKERGRHSRV